jgi:hypothetical protein
MADKLKGLLKTYRVYLALASFWTRVKGFCSPSVGNWVAQNLGSHVY